MVESSFTSAVLTLDYGKGTPDNPKIPDPRGGCYPSARVAYQTNYLKVSDTGALTGKCGNQNAAITVDGTLTGTLDRKARTVSFHLESKQVSSYANTGNGTATITAVLDGSGQLSTETQATGSATWTATCQATSDIPETCKNQWVGGELGGGTNPWRATGAVPFVMDFKP